MSKAFHLYSYRLGRSWIFPTIENAKDAAATLCTDGEPREVNEPASAEPEMRLYLNGWKDSVTITASDYPTGKPVKL